LLKASLTYWTFASQQDRQDIKDISKHQQDKRNMLLKDAVHAGCDAESQQDRHGMLLRAKQTKPWYVAESRKDRQDILLRASRTDMICC
jgi:hypothetical protein